MQSLGSKSAGFYFISCQSCPLFFANNPCIKLSHEGQSRIQMSYSSCPCLQVGGPFRLFTHTLSTRTTYYLFPGVDRVEVGKVGFHQTSKVEENLFYLCQLCHSCFRVSWCFKSTRGRLRWQYLNNLYKCTLVLLYLNNLYKCTLVLLYLNIHNKLNTKTKPH